MGRNDRRVRYPEDAILQDSLATDIVIPFMGQTKAGKSSLINTLLPPGTESLRVGKEMVSCTTEIKAVIIDGAPDEYKELNRALSGRRIVLLDTPGFDDTDMRDDEVLMRVARWLEASYRKDMLVGGVLYLHDITKDGWTGTSKKNLKLFTKICGEDAMSQVSFVTTKWGNLADGRLRQGGIARTTELRERHWKALLEQGATVCHLQPPQEEDRGRLKVGQQAALDPWEIIHHLVVRMNARDARYCILAIQDELVTQNRFLVESSAGQELRMSLKELLRRAKELQKEAKEDAKLDSRSREVLQERQREIDLILAQLENLKPSVQRRLNRWFRGALGLKGGGK